MTAPALRLGLIGDNIAASSAPALHRLAGRLCGREVSYERLVPAELGLDFDGTFDHARDNGFDGLNITYPYKERVTERVVIDDPAVRALGAVNTVLFGASGPWGHNTDHSGFIAACRSALGSGGNPGCICQIGAGGVGRAVAFGLLSLGVTQFRIVERDRPRAEALARALSAARPGTAITLSDDSATAAIGAEGLINCTPVGMVGHAGTPLPRSAMTGASWAFDAVYTPVETEFLHDAAEMGLRTISGYELFIHQGLHAWKLFAGMEVDEQAIRAGLAISRP